jgi:hypothetical protein
MVELEQEAAERKADADTRADLKSLNFHSLSIEEVALFSIFDFYYRPPLRP